MGRLDPRRDLTYVADSVDGFVRAGTTPNLEGTCTQLGTGVSVSIAELFALACKVLGVDAAPIQDSRRMRPDASEVLVLESDPALARTRLGWSPSVSLENGIRQTAEWVRSNLHHYNLDYLHV